MSQNVCHPPAILLLRFGKVGVVSRHLSADIDSDGGLKLRQVESFFFGKNKQLFGMYHPATVYPRRHGIVICPPLFHEYYRSHFTTKRIAVELACKGYDVLRFDYSGTGDSKGDIPPLPFDAWSRDIGDAITETGQLGNYKNLSVVTARFSAALALPWRQLISKYICWDPVLDRDRYLEQIDATNSKSLADHTSMSQDERRMHAENDFLGTGVLRTTIKQSLFQFTDRLNEEGQYSLPDDSVEVHSDVSWVTAATEMIYAHDVIKQVSDAM